jgi:glycosyltransferase involved in cell wall biosynthesis
MGGARRAVIEIHQPSVFWSRHDRLAFRLARRNKRLRIVCISASLAGVVAREWGLDESQIIVEHSAHNFPIRDDYRADSVTGRRLRALYVGSFDPGKGIDTIFEVARLHPGVDFVAVGGQVSETELPDNISVRPRVAHAQVPDLLAQADILLMPFSTYSRGGLPTGATGAAEEFYSPLKMMEYLSAGRAIISSNLPSIAEVLVDGSNCLLVEPDSLTAWSSALRRLEGDPGLRERLARGAAHTARRHTTIERARRILEGIGVGT